MLIDKLDTFNALWTHSIDCKGYKFIILIDHCVFFPFFFIISDFIASRLAFVSVQLEQHKLNVFYRRLEFTYLKLIQILIEFSCITEKHLILNECGNVFAFQQDSLKLKHLLFELVWQDFRVKYNQGLERNESQYLQRFFSVNFWQQCKVYTKSNAELENSHIESNLNKNKQSLES